MTVSIETKLVNLAHGASASYQNWSGMIISPEKFLEMIETTGDTDYFREEVDYPGAYEEPADGLDTCVRDVVFDVLARYIGFSHWPINGDTEEFSEAFKAKLIEWIKEDVN